MLKIPIRDGKIRIRDPEKIFRIRNSGSEQKENLVGATY